MPQLFIPELRMTVTYAQGADIEAIRAKYMKPRQYIRGTLTDKNNCLGMNTQDRKAYSKRKHKK